MVGRVPENKSAHFVEVGCWVGSSAAAMCVEIKNSNKKIRFDCVDIWSDNMYVSFIKNLSPVAGYFNPVRKTSIEAAKLYEDNSLDFVCIDADHSYKFVKEDILAWLPKVKSGGVLGGDDYYASWPGVTKAVDELLPKAKIIKSSFWYIIKS